MRFIVIGTLTCLLSSAQTPAPAVKQAPAAKKSAAPAAAPKTLTVDGILSMVQAGISDSLIVTRLRKEKRAFDLGADDLVKLKKAGVSESILQVMLDPTAELAPASAPPAAVAVATPAPAPVAVPPPAPVAAPAPATPVSEIGVYTKKGETWIDVLPEVVNWKTGGVLKSIATAGVMKGDVNGNIEGPNSRNTVKTPLEFLVYTPEGVAITEYQLLRLRSNKSYREFRTVTGGIMHAKGGATRDLIPFEHKKLAPRVYEIVFPANMGSGEYGFLPPGAFGSASSASIGKMHTFRLME